ncbi:hypothetical protein BH23PSE2_BH23PSE2_14100 [soil metagenome]
MVTVPLKAVSFGTKLHVLQEGLPDVLPLQQCSLGWQESLVLPARLVETRVREGLWGSNHGKDILRPRFWPRNLVWLGPPSTGADLDDSLPQDLLQMRPPAQEYRT